MAGGSPRRRCGELFGAEKKYRDRLRAHCPGVEFLHLSGSAELIAGRLAARADHFMPAALLRSQLDTLEALGPDEAGMTVDAGQDVEAIIDAVLRSRRDP